MRCMAHGSISAVHGNIGVVYGGVDHPHIIASSLGGQGMRNVVLHRRRRAPVHVKEQLAF
jgi:hypothetical protein